ncbi:MAG: 2-C-methyl-D-erythritol 2,4-cyclodiphosphate synthase [Ruminococcaceae bacterium]|nr:2-C-methyl-D-erythritol 2,4-cyclodiphosphate synthase [Oscillospiraceae bacterium]
MSDLRIGHGYDVHRLTEGRKLILGGVDVPHSLGLLGHSDADVLIHAVIDAIIGAIGEGDIGRHFPDTSDEFKGISSMNLLVRVRALMESHGAIIENIDSTLIIQKPKIAPYIEKMRQNISFALGCDVSRVNVKATTEEKLGFTGREEGISAHAVVLLSLK